MYKRITFTVADHDLPPQVFTFDKHSECVVGRGPKCDLRLPTDLMHRDVSRQHCVVEVDPPEVHIRDLGSLNGTFVNGENIGQRQSEEPKKTEKDQLPNPVELHDGDEIQIGHTVLRVRIDEPEQELPPPLVPMLF